MALRDLVFGDAVTVTGVTDVTDSLTVASVTTVTVTKPANHDIEESNETTESEARRQKVLSIDEEQAIRGWLELIEETDAAIITEVLNQCQRDADARAYFIKLATAKIYPEAAKGR